MAVIGISAAGGRRQWAWTAINGLQLGFTMGWTVALTPVAALVRIVTRGQRWPLRLASRVWAPGLLHGAGVRLVVEGADKVDWSRPHVLVANHESMIDICALFRAVPVPLRFMLKQELAKVPVIGWFARQMGMVFIERGVSRSAPQRLREAVSRVQRGATLVAFPEGTRGRGAVGAFKGGAFQVAIAAGVPVVPVSIEGSGAVLPTAGFRVRPGTIRVRFGTPLPTEGLAESDRSALAHRARDAVVALLGRP